MKALIIGGTRGIGAATAEALTERGWDVTAWGRDAFNVHDEFDMSDEGFVSILPACDALIFSAGSIETVGSLAFDFPVSFYRIVKCQCVNDNGVIIAVSSVAADKPAKVNPHYAAAKAALESYARTVADSDMARAHKWRVEVIRFDLVQTEMLNVLPADSLTGRKVISAETAAAQILTLMGVEL